MLKAGALVACCLQKGGGTAYTSGEAQVGATSSIAWASSRELTVTQVDAIDGGTCLDAPTTVGLPVAVCAAVGEGWLC